MRFFFPFLLICCMQSVHADFIWPTAFIILKLHSLPVIISGLLIEIGFVKYFTKVPWKRSVIVGIVMNLASATLGIALISIVGILFMGLLMLLTKFCSSRILDLVFGYLKIFDSVTISGFWLIGYICAVYINVYVEQEVIQKMLKLPLSKTFKWLTFANLISVGICFAPLGGEKLGLSFTDSIGMPILVMCVYSIYLLYLHLKERIGR